MSDLLKYLADWDKPGRDGDAKNASGADSSGQVDGENYDGNVSPSRWNMPVSPEWGIGEDGNSGGYGHSADCKETTDYAAWDMKKSDVALGFERPKSDGKGGGLETRQPDGSFPQSIPDSNPHDRGAGSDSYAREHSDTTGRGFDGRGQPKSTSNSGGETLGSRMNQG